MNDVQNKLLELKDRGWTMAAIADELEVSHMSVFRWKKGMRKVGKFKLGRGKTAGFCAKRNITEVVRRRAGAIRACYEDRLQVKPELAGKVTIRWRIEFDGKVGSANVLKTTLGDSKVESCVLRAIRRMRFQKPEGGVCIIQWPFVFRNK